MWCACARINHALMVRSHSINLVLSDTSYHSLMRTATGDARAKTTAAQVATDQVGPLRVRLAREEDVAALPTLLRALGYTADNEAELGALLRATLDRPDLAVFLAIGHEGPLGLLGLSQRPQLHLGGTLVSIDALAILPEARGRGIGRRLLRRAIAYARLHRAVRIELHTTRARENYRRGFYPANGYREVDSALFRRDLRPIATDYGQAGNQMPCGGEGKE